MWPQIGSSRREGRLAVPRAPAAEALAVRGSALASVVCVCGLAIATALYRPDAEISAWAGTSPLLLIPLGLLACWLLRPQLPARFATRLTDTGALVYILLGLDAIGRVMD
jgi:hypothetical protein